MPRSRPTAHRALLKAATFQRSGGGRLNLPSGKVKFSDVVIARLPDRLRIVVELDRGLKITTILDGKKGWKGIPGAVVDLPPETIDELREEAYVLWIATLAPLLGEGFVLTPAGQQKLDGKPCFGPPGGPQGPLRRDPVVRHDEQIPGRHRQGEQGRRLEDQETLPLQ